jgi:hypothetical protein
MTLVSFVTIHKGSPGPLLSTIASYTSLSTIDPSLYELVVIYKMELGQLPEQLIIDSCTNVGATLYIQRSNGIYQAFNESMSYLSGEWVLYLNSGDTLLPDSSKNIMQALICLIQVSTNIQAVYFPVLLHDPQYGFIGIKPLGILPENLLPLFFLILGRLFKPSHQGIYYRRSYLLDNPFLEGSRIDSDHTHLKQLFRSSSLKQSPATHPHCEYDLSGISSLPFDLSFSGFKRSWATYGLRGLLKSLVHIFINTSILRRRIYQFAYMCLLPWLGISPNTSSKAPKDSPAYYQV